MLLELSAFTTMKADMHEMLQEIAENLYFVKGENRGRFPFSHSILIRGECNVLFDTGSGVRVLERLKAEIPVDLVVNSHTHPDHFSGNHCFGGLELVVPELFADILGDLERMSVRLAEGGEPAAQWLFMVTEILQHEPTEPTGAYAEGWVVEAGGYAFEAIHTPGHTADTLSVEVVDSITEDDQTPPVLVA